LNELDADGATMLHSATLNSKEDLAKALLAAGADVNAKDKFGKTPIFYARDQKLDGMIAILQAAGAE
jgi:ankyrin repeat protein